jgi:hypothetical protein
VTPVAAVGQKRWPLAVLAVIGIALILAPVAFGMFTKAPDGASMMTSFSPFMTRHRLDGFQADMRYVGNAVAQGQRAIRAAGRTPAGARTVARVAPPFATFARQWQAVNSDMGGMLVKIKANLPNYQAVAALPSFRAFPWFFLIPGAILLIVAAIGLARSTAWRALRWVAVVLGLALVLTPVGVQMFSRAPKGAQMMSTFKTIETRQHLRRIQSYFSDMAVGQGLVQLQLVPALRHTGLSTAQIQARYPALNALDANWIHILNDMTPMIAAMSNNIANYQAISSLPSFRLFPWFFLLPGLIVIAIALVGARRGGSGGAERERPGLFNPVNQGVT